jgi:sugar O-acyltransferase (sialic acid O-acetyltransferase NeuD family)
MADQTWTIFGVGNLTGDLIDAVESLGDTVKYVVLNMKVEEEALANIQSSIAIIKLEYFTPQTNHYFFGFVNPNKGYFLASLEKHHLVYANLIHSRAYVPRNVSLGQGNYIGPGAVLATHVGLGDFNYINRLASVGHNTQLSSFNELGPGCTVAGNCHIGSRNHLFSGCVVINALQIGDGITIGAGGVVVKNILEAGNYVGVPVKKLDQPENGIL